MDPSGKISSENSVALSQWVASYPLLDFSDKPKAKWNRLKDEKSIEIPAFTFWISINVKHDSTTIIRQGKSCRCSSNFSWTILSQGGFRTSRDIAGAIGYIQSKVFKISIVSIEMGKIQMATILKELWKSFPRIPSQILLLAILDPKLLKEFKFLIQTSMKSLQRTDFSHPTLPL